MNKRRIPLTAAALLLAAGNIYADSDLKLYGKANLSLNQIEKEATELDEWQLNSNASRLGVKGYADINDSLKVIYKMEFEVYIDDGDSGDKKDNDTFEQRNIYAGLEGDFGRIIAGKHDTPLKLAQGKIDRFNDLPVGDIKNFMEGEDRVSNIVMYTTPKFSGFSATAALVPGENSETEGGDDGLSDGTSISFNYSNDMVTAAVASNSEIDGQDTIRLAADVKLGIFKIGALVQTAEDADGDAEEDSFLVSAEAKLGDGFALKAQYGMTEYDDPADTSDDEDTQMVFGIDKKLNKNAKLYTYYAVVEQDDGNEANDYSTLGLGAEFKF